MSGVTEPLVLDLVEWVAQRPRAYAEVMEAWRTSCPRLTVWEEALERGLVVRADPVRVTPLGLQCLAEYGRGLG
ncbi:hypothetical protein [Roseomonas sp. WA12]